MDQTNTDALVERLRAGVRQRRAEQAAQGDLGPAARLAELYRHQTLSERPPRSHRRVLGPFIVGLKSFVARLLSWQIRPLVQQQSQYNAAATRAILGLAEECEELRRENSALRAEVDTLLARENAGADLTATGDGA